MTSRAMAKREKMAGINATLSDTERSGEHAQAETKQASPAEVFLTFFFRRGPESVLKRPLYMPKLLY